MEGRRNASVRNVFSTKRVYQGVGLISGGVVEGSRYSHCGLSGKSAAQGAINSEIDIQQMVLEKAWRGSAGC